MSLRRPPPPIPQKPKRLQSSELPVADNERPVSPQDTGPGRRVSVSALRNMFEANQDDSSSSIPPVPAIPKSRSSIVPFPSLTVTNPSQQIETPLVDSDNPFLADEEVNSKIPNRIISPNPPQNAPPLIRRPMHRSLSHSSVSNIFDDPNLVVMSPATDVPPSPRPQSTVHQLAVKLEISTNLQSSHIPSMRHESSINSPYHNSKLDSPSLAQSKYLSPVPQTPGSKSMTRSSSFSTIEEIHSQEKKEKEGAELDMLAENVKKHKKRFNLTLELLNTELAYLQDIKLLDEVYCRPSTELKIFSAADSKAIFTNLPDVISCSEEFAEILKASTGGLVNANGEIVEEPEEKWIWSDWDRDDHFCWIGEAFLQMMTKLEDVYCDYCTRHEVSLGKLAELSKGSNPQIIKFLKEAREKIQGRTTSWDLASMLIKPVQRVLKYPLLLKQILALTPSVHPDYPHLEKALAGIENVAEKINEIKKRKELVEKIVTGDKEVNIRHGITKNLTRTKQQLKQATGLSMDVAVDDLYASVEEKFNFQKTQAQTFISDIITWLSSLKQFFNQLHDLAISLEDLYTAFSPPRSSSSSPLPNFSKVTIPRSAEFRKFAGKLGLEMTQQMEKSLRDKLFPIFEKMMGLFDNPATVMKKRDRKFLDYMSVKEITNKGETPDKTLLESADAYSAINAQLIDELPKFFALQEQFFDIVVIQFVSIQATFYRSYQDQILQVLSHGLQDIDKMVLMTEIKNEEVRECWERKFSSVKPMVDEIEVMGLAKEMREKGLLIFSSVTQA
ncbi:hypothetical protein BKA69DRAFT_1045174 [Paraphysoderma sedebokerense]|nr:hypothetical protein BKA69DRAFT_1045174 [Paraphysoderma sedebokerense]